MERIYGIDRAAAHAGGMTALAVALGVTPQRLARWRRDAPEQALKKVMGLGYSQLQLGELLGVAQTTVSKWAREDIPPDDNPEPRNAVELAVQKAGSQSALARRLGVTQVSVYRWVKRGYVPAARAQEIEMHYGVPRLDLINPKLRNAIGVGGEL